MQKIQLNYKRNFVIILIILISGLVSCATGQNVSSLSSLGNNNVLLVGRVILDPPLQPTEYKKRISIYGSTGYIYLHYSNELKKLKNLDIDLSVMSNSMKTENANTFYLKFKNKPLYVYYGFIPMDFDIDLNSFIYAYLPAGWVVNTQSDDKAIYIGTIRYTRDEFFRITKVEIIDEYDAVSKEFYAKYGNSIPLKKSLLKSM